MVALHTLVSSFTYTCLLVFRRYDPNFIAASLDEAYLDITEVCKERNVKSEKVSCSIRLSLQWKTF